jgi:putative tryptophan/tyrosine transport system substrate-binding protein
VTAFHRGLREVGFFEGQNIAVEYRWAQEQYERLPTLADDLARRPVAVIVAAGGTSAALAAKAATQSIPIVFFVGTNPADVGLVASLSRPGGNATGVTLLNADLIAKRIEVIHEMVPAARIIALLVNPTGRAMAEVEQGEAELAARALGLQLLVLNASNQSDIESAFAALVQQRAGAVVVSSDVVLLGRREQVADCANRHGVPTIYPYRQFVTAGGLMSYGADELDGIRLVANYTGRILKGAKPADLPVQQTSKVELVINLKTAKSLGLIFPLPLLGRADEVIE